jgi:hypothetical protein
MASHSQALIKKLEGKLKERYDNLVSCMGGRPVDETEIRAFNVPNDHRHVSSADVRIAIDDFSTILKEIKATLGKR